MTTKRNITSSQSCQGFALILALIIAGVVLSIGLSLLNITVKQLTLSSTARESEIAFQVANAAMECLSLGRYNILNESDEMITYFPASSRVLETGPTTCLGGSFVFSSPDNSSSDQLQFSDQGNWDIGDGVLRCFDTDLYVFDQGASMDIRSVENEPCDGTTCFIGVARGYNRSCEDVANSVYAVEREITAEF